MVQQLVMTEIWLGLPYYMWLVIPVLIVFLALCGYIYYLHIVYGTLSAYKEAWRKGDHLGIVITGLGKLKMYPLEYMQSVLSNVPMLLKWHVKVPYNLSLNGVPCCILTDTFYTMGHPDILLAIQEIVDEHNKNALTEGEKITDYEGLMHHLTHLPPSEEVRLPPIAVVKIHEILNYINPAHVGEFDGLVNREIARRKPPGEDWDGMPGWLKILTGIWVIVGLIIAIIVLWGGG